MSATSPLIVAVAVALVLPTTVSGLAINTVGAVVNPLPRAPGVIVLIPNVLTAVPLASEPVENTGRGSIA